MNCARMKKQGCGAPPAFYVVLIFEGKGSTPYHDDYYCDEHAAELPWEGEQFEGSTVIERTDKELR